MSCVHSIEYTPFLFFSVCVTFSALSLALYVCALPSHCHHDKKAMWACAYVYDREAKWKRLKLKWHDFLTMWRLEVALTSHAFFSFHIYPFAFMSKCYKFTFPISEMPLVWFTIFSVAYFSQNKQPLCAGVFECAVYAWQCLCVHSKEWCECVPEWFSQWMKPTMRHKEPRQHIERPRWEVPWLFFICKWGLYTDCTPNHADSESLWGPQCWCLLWQTGPFCVSMV